MKWRKKTAGQKNRWRVGRLVEMYGNDCFLCGRPIETRKEMTVDHWIPVSKGGSSELHNLRLAHPECNEKKADMMPDEWPGG